jgi:hypothetical protein
MRAKADLPFRFCHLDDAYAKRAAVLPVLPVPGREARRLGSLFKPFSPVLFWITVSTRFRREGLDTRGRSRERRRMDLKAPAHANQIREVLMV